ASLTNAFRVVYAVPSDIAPDPAIVPGILHEIDLVAGWFSGQTGGRQPRFYAPGGTLAVDTVNLRITRAAIAGASGPLTTLADTLHGLGYGVSGETVVAYVASKGTACGITEDHDGAATTVALWMPACNIYPSATTPSFPYNATYLAAHEMTHA